MIIYDRNILQTIPTKNLRRNAITGIRYWKKKLKLQKNHKNTSNRDIVERERKIKQNDTDRIEKSSENKGKEQYLKDLSTKNHNDRNKLDELVRKSNRSIISISSIFPWSFFPDSIDVEESRVTFIFRQLLTSQSHSVDIKDISNVFIESGFFFSNLQVVSRTFIQNDIKIQFLRKEEAIQTKKIIEGLRTLTHNNINTSNYEIGDLVSQLKKLSTTKDMYC
jgi:hypothetical protein